jgi:amino acid transporter
MAVAYSVAAFVLPPLFGFQSTALNAAVITAGLLIIFALLTMFSTLITTRINEYAVITEIVGMLGFGLLLFIVVAFRGGLHWDYLVNSGSAASTNYFSLGLVNHGQNSPWVLAFILPLFTLFGFEGCANVAEDMKHDPRIQVPRAIFYSELTAWLAGLIFLILTITAAGNLRAVTNSSSALSFIMTEQLGGVLGRIFLIVVLYSVFACGLVLFLSTTRMVWAMSRDNRFPGSAIWQRVNSRTGTPLLAAVMVGVALLVILGVFVQQTNVWNNLLGATSLPPFLIYPIVIIVYLMNRRRLPEAKVFRLGRWDVPVAALALVWIAFGLSVFKSGFNSAWVYTGGGIVLGGVYLIWHRVRTGPMSQPSGRRQDSDAQAIETISSP